MPAYAFDNALIFVTGGAAWMNNEISGSATVTPPGVTLSLSDSRTHTGYTIGRDDHASRYACSSNGVDYPNALDGVGDSCNVG
jgi:hypothetical protein